MSSSNGTKRSAEQSDAIAKAIGKHPPDRCVVNRPDGSVEVQLFNVVGHKSKATIVASDGSMTDG